MVFQVTNSGYADSSSRGRLKPGPSAGELGVVTAVESDRDELIDKDEGVVDALDESED